MPQLVIVMDHIAPHVVAATREAPQWIPAGAATKDLVADDVIDVAPNARATPIACVVVAVTDSPRGFTVCPIA